MIAFRMALLASLLSLLLVADLSPDQQQALQRAGNDAARLLEIARAWDSAGAESAAQAAFERVLATDPGNTEAHRGLRHHLYQGQWFETHAALSRFQRAEDERMLRDKGLVRYRDRWVAPVERTWLEFGLTQDASGAWTNPGTSARLARESALVARGAQQQDQTWILPAEFERWKQGLWKCGDEWKNAADADVYHSAIETPWLVTGDHFAVLSTCSRADLEWVKWWADATWDDLVRLFGVVPGARPTPLDLLGPKHDMPTFVCLRSLAQYNSFAAGDPNTQRALTEQEGFSSLHYTYFAESWFDLAPDPPLYRGAGVAFWEHDNPTLAPFGQHSVRHAAAQSFIEAVDPSWRALIDARETGLTSRAFWAEKELPRWLRYGAASYVERWFVDAKVGKDGDPMWARNWALANLKDKGGLGSLDDVFAFKLSLQDADASTRLIHQAGLIVAFALDGHDARVDAALQSFQTAMKADHGVREAAHALESALIQSEVALRAFAGL